MTEPAPVMVELPSGTAQVAVTLTQTKGLPLPPAIGARVLQAPDGGVRTIIEFRGRAVIEAYGWRGDTLTYSAPLEDFEVIEVSEP